MQRITVTTQTMQGDIFIGEDVLPLRLPTLTAGQKNFVVTDSNVFALYPSLFETYFKSAEIFVLPCGEEYKNFQFLQAILEKMTGAGLKRTSRLFAVGGGIVGDIASLAASLYMRGISLVQIPTTLLSQIDSSVGGKTAINVGGVKNVVGAFYQPQEVLIDPSFLSTLDKKQLKCGLGEMVKYAALSGDMFDILQANLEKLMEIEFLSGLIEGCIRHKADVVQKDEKELGERISLNVGHTTGHAIELACGLSHGESVLFGMYLETKLALSHSVCEKEYGNSLLRLIQTALQHPPQGLVDFSNPAFVEEMLCKAKLDKKNTEDGEIKMTVAKRKNEWTVLSLPFEIYKQNLKEIISGIH